MATTFIGTNTDVAKISGVFTDRNEIRSHIYVEKWELSGTYAAGGFAYGTAGTGTPAGQNVSDVWFVEPGGFTNGTLVYHAQWDPDNDKVKLFTGTNTTGLVEAANGTDFASYVGYVKTHGV